MKNLNTIIESPYNSAAVSSEIKYSDGREVYRNLQRLLFDSLPFPDSVRIILKAEITQKQNKND